jgi:repressor LexA
MRPALTDKQRQILDAIEQATTNDGRPPSIPELMKLFGITSPNGIAKHLKALETKGYLDRKKGARGSVVTSTQEMDVPDNNSANREITLSDFSAKQVPILGTIAAGSPILAEQNIEDQVTIPHSLAGNGESFMLRIKGDSMIDEGILSGDLVVIEKCERVRDGEIAAVLVEEEATLKRFYQRGHIAILEPANSNYRPIEVDMSSESCKILGKLVGLVRSYRTRI